MVDLTISIVNHKHKELLEPLLKSIAAYTKPDTYEVYVVDNASHDGSVEMIQAQFPWVKLLCNTQPKGFAANNNQVLSISKGRYVILLNDDMILRNDALDRMVAFLDSSPSIGAVGCKLLNEDGTIQRSCWRGFPSPKTLLIDLFYLSKWLPWISWVREFEVILEELNGPLEVDYLLGACLMVRREIINQVGLLDEDFFMFLEETDWCYRIKKHGWRVAWIPDGNIVHYGQQSVGKSPRQFLPMLYTNYFRFCKKHGASNYVLMKLKAIILAGVMVRAALWTYRWHQGRSTAQSMVDGYLHAFSVIMRLKA